MSSYQASLLLLLCAWTVTGCGTIRKQRATEQLLLSDAVDRSVANIDFSPLAYQNVYLDTRFLEFKNDSAVSTNYVISALRQQMVVASCLLKDNILEADYIVEARIGTLGSDGHDMHYGIPASNTLNAAASVIAGSPAIPVLPEISLARKTKDMAAAKIAVFAYHRETRMPVWQSGTSLARSEATATWILGAGPFQRGSIYEGTQFAGNPLRRKKRDRLTSRESVFQGTTIWDEKLRQRVESGAHLVPPQFDHQGPSDESEQISRSNNSKEQL